MKNSFLKNVSLRRKVFLTIIVVVLLNTLSIFFWYNFRITPELEKNDKLVNTIIKNELKNSYVSVNDFLKEINRISDKYKIDFSVLDKSNNLVFTNKTANKNFIISSYNIMINNEVYTINTYNNKNFSLAKITLKLIIFQIIIISLIMIIIYKFTGNKIIKPIEKIINDIKNYKFGKKPVKNKLNNEFDLIQNEFVNLVDTLENEKAEQNRIIASISHDIKTPLTSVIGYSSLIDEGNMTKEEMKKYNLKIKEKAMHIKNILNTFDDYLINYDNQPLKLDAVKISDIVKELNNDYKIELENKGIAFNVNTKIGHKYINVDVLKLKRIFSNIISNSIRYIEKEGKINIDIIDSDNMIKFIISDNGIGIEENLLNRIFDPFFTTDKSRKISGLGLSICKEFALMHQGTIKAYNNNGLTIEFTISKDLKS